jgi:NitT/TauT family transport system substrate-binding protein/sulfonate transport system substrate-binding protein
MLRSLVRSVAAVAMAALWAGSSFAAEPLKEINISYVESPFNLQTIVMRKQELLEKEFAADGVKINWHNITSGAQQAQAMAAGSLDIGGVMNTTSVLLANAGGNPVLIAILGKAGGPKTIEELKGKQVVGPRGTVLHQILAAALASKGMSLDDVEFIGMDLPKSQAALVAGQTDAALLAASLKIKAEAAGATVIATADGLVNPVLVMGVSKAFADAHPDTVARVQRVNTEATAWVLAHLDEATEIGAKEQGIPLEDGKKLAAWGNFTDTLTDKNIASIKDDMKFLIDNDMMKGTVDVEALMLPGALAATAQ